MTTDKGKIQEAMQLVTGSDSYIALTMNDFDTKSKNPDVLIHVVGKDAGEVIGKISEEFSAFPPRLFTTVLGFIRGGSLTMGELDRLRKCVPEEWESKWGLDFGHPDGGEVEVFIFYEL